MIIKELTVKKKKFINNCMSFLKKIPKKEQAPSIEQEKEVKWEKFKEMLVSISARNV